MYLTELVLQGVRTFSQPRKLTFTQGFNVLVGNEAGGRATVCDVLLHLFYPHYQNEKLLNLFSSQPPQPACRAGVSFQHKESLFRNVMDFSQGVANLSRMNNQSFENVSQDANQISEFLTKEMDVPRAEVYRSILLTEVKEFPSYHSTSQGPLSISNPGAMTDSQQDPQALVRELEQLRKLQHDAQVIKEKQFEIDGLHKKVFEWTDIQKRAAELEGKLSTLQKSLKEIGDVPEIPDDLEARAEAYDKAKRKKENELPSITQEVFEIEDVLKYSQPQLPQSDSTFLLGIGLLVGSIIVAIATGSMDVIFGLPRGLFIKILLVVSLIGLVITAVRFFSFLSSKANYDNLQKDLKKGQEKIRNIERRFDVETSVVRSIMKALNVDSTNEMFANIGRIRKIQKEMKEIKTQLEAEQAKPGYQQAVKELPEAKKLAQKMEQELQLLSATPLNAEQISYQIAQLEAQAKSMGAAIPQQPTPGNSDSLGIAQDDFIQQIGHDFYHNPTHRLVAIAANALQIPMMDFAAKLIPPLDKNLHAFSFGNLGESKIDPDGTFSVQDQEIKSRVRFEQMEPFKQDLCYFAIKFTILQFFLREKPLPVLLDNPFQSFDERMVDVFAKAIQFLSQQSQVLLLTDREQYGQGAASVQSLN